MFVTMPPAIALQGLSKQRLRAGVVALKDKQPSKAAHAPGHIGVVTAEEPSPELQGFAKQGPRLRIVASVRPDSAESIQGLGQGDRAAAGPPTLDANSFSIEAFSF